MAQFAAGKKALGVCDRCGFQYLLSELKPLTVKTKNINTLVCPTCWEPDHPQLRLGMYIVQDPQALRDPRPDISYDTSRNIQWGWNPVGLNNSLAISGLPNKLVADGEVGTVTVTVS